MDFVQLEIGDKDKIRELSKMAVSIVKAHFDPIIGSAQNDYMIAKFQTEESISEQLSHGYRYYFVRQEGENLGFLAFYPRKGYMYLSKFYLYEEQRGKGYARAMLAFVAEAAKTEGLNAIELNVNRNNPVCDIYESLGFSIARCEKNDIGGGFYMDDYVYRKEL